jgi:hypothetical protein
METKAKPIGKPNEKAPVTIGDVLHAKKLAEKEKQEAIAQADPDKQPE